MRVCARVSMCFMFKRFHIKIGTFWLYVGHRPQTVKRQGRHNLPFSSFYLFDKKYYIKRDSKHRTYPTFSLNILLDTYNGRDILTTVSIFKRLLRDNLFAQTYSLSKKKYLVITWY